MTVRIAPDARMQFFDSQGNVLAGGLLFTYAASTTTKRTTYTDSGGGTGNTNPIVLDSAGRTPHGVWLTEGLSYKFVLSPANDTDPPASPIWTEDDIQGVNDANLTLDRWIGYGTAGTYVTALSFTVPGDQTGPTGVFQIGRRLKTSNTSGDIYSTITGSSFGAGVTTVTVEAGPLDSGLTTVSYGLEAADFPSIPNIFDVGDGLIRTFLAGRVKYTAALGFLPMLNGTLVTSVGSSALTVALKTYAGTDPSTTDPVYFFFRSATAATGDFTVIKVTAALSLVVSSGSTLGTSSATAARLYIVAFNDAGTVRLGIYNPLSGTSLIGLWDDLLYSSTAEGGAGAADSAQVIYTGTAVTTKAQRTIGYIEATEATAGTWATNASKVQLMGPGVPRTGMEIQCPRNQSGAVNTGTGIIPFDDTIPQIGEGDQFLTQAITPTSTINLLKIKARMYLSTSVAQRQGLAIFQDATAGALAAGWSMVSSNDFVCEITVEHAMAAGTTSSTTFRGRTGQQVAGTVTFNGNASARIYGGVAASQMEVREIFV